MSRAEADWVAWTREHRVAYELAPLLEMRAAEKVQSGFTLSLYAAAPMDKAAGAERQQAGRQLWEELRALAEAAVPPPSAGAWSSTRRTPHCFARRTSSSPRSASPGASSTPTCARHGRGPRPAHRPREASRHAGPEARPLVGTPATTGVVGYARFMSITWRPMRRRSTAGAAAAAAAPPGSSALRRRAGPDAARLPHHSRALERRHARATSSTTASCCSRARSRSPTRPGG